MKKFLKVAIITIIVLIMGYSLVNAEEIDDLKAKREKIEKQINETNEVLGEVKVELTEAIEEIESLEKKIDEYSQDLDTVNSELDKLQTEITQAKNVLETIEESYRIQKEILEKRLVTLYEEGEVQYLDVLLNSKNIIEFISNYYLIGEIAENDTELLENIEKEKEQIEKLQKILTEKQNKLKEVKDSQEKSLVALENTKVVRNNYLNKLTKEELELQKELDTYEQELDKLDLQILYLTVGTLEADYVGGEFAWPVPGYTTITSPFGMRLHPILKIYRIHNGLDIGAPTGATIIAANSGVVTSATYLSAYGNTVIIDHGGGVSSLYAHGSKILVKVGDVVERGQPIMEIGSTGLSTGPHLHLGISINGEYVDPYPFITSTSDDTKDDDNE